MDVNNNIQRPWVERKDYFALLVVFSLLPIASQAGGLGIAAIAALGGALTLLGLGPTKLIAIVKKAPLPVWAIMALLIYGLASSIWSPYQSSRTLPNPMILVLGMPLYSLLARAIFVHAKFESKWLRRIWVWGTVASAIAILFDLTTGYSISLAIDPVSPGEIFEARRGDLIQNLGHGVAVSTLLFPAVAVTLWGKSAVGKFLAVLLAFIVLAGSHFAGMSASTFALLLALLFMAGASLWPWLVILCIHLLGALTLVGAPIIAFGASRIPDHRLEVMPFSWEERIHNWRFVLNKILEHPVLGHGFDAVRTFDDKHAIRGFEERAIVSLHPHNAGLHIWVELGLIGIMLSVIAIYLSYSSITRRKSIGKPFAIALCGTGAATIVNASLTFGVWQDWWWAIILIAFSSVALIPYTTENI